VGYYPKWAITQIKNPIPEYPSLVDPRIKPLKGFRFGVFKNSKNI